MLAPWLVVALQVTTASAPTCVSAQGQMACGYHCTSNLNQMACSATPEGLCDSTPSRVACWDPPADVRMLMATRDDLPQPTCVRTLDKVACGFHCVRTNSQVACSDSPMGACMTRFGKATCWDPPVEVRWSMEQSGQLVDAQCATSLSFSACGYHCDAIADAVACSASPDGFCKEGLGKVACFDPQPNYVPVAFSR
jgi:hypothetical protein